MTNAPISLLAISLLSIPICSNESFFLADTSYIENGDMMICSLGENYNADDPISVIVSLNYNAPSTNMDPKTNSLEEVQDYISEIRAFNKNYYTEMNSLALEELECGDLMFRCSSYSPFLFCEFENYYEFEGYIDILESISELEIVRNVYAEPLIDFVSECMINYGDSLSLIPMETAKSMIGIGSTSFTGSGIKVGILDEGIPYFDNFMDGQLKAIYYSSFSDHTTKVASIIGGMYGIATEADLYIRPLVNSLDTSIEWLLDHDVNIINMSMGVALGAIYDGRSAYFDYLVSNEYVSIVKSAGNLSENNQSRLITSPGMGLNVFSVGSVDRDKVLSYFSSYNIDAAYYGIIMKPTLVAPGENVIIPNTINSTLNEQGNGFDINCSGTSFAAPMVTGCLALLMEQFPQLIVSPELAMSAVVNGAKKLPSQTTLVDNNCGAGLLNYSETVSILSDGYNLLNVPNGASNGYLAGSRAFTIPAKSYADLSFAHIINGNVTSPYNGTAPLAFSKYTIVVTDSNGLTVATSSNNSNINLITVSNTGSVPKTMVVSIYLNGSKVENGTEHSALTIFIHDHAYTHHFVNYSLTQHKSYCECGEYVLLSHVPDVVNAYISNGHIYAPCLYCGALIDVGGDGPIIPIEPFSNNQNCN